MLSASLLLSAALLAPGSGNGLTEDQNFQFDTLSTAVVAAERGITVSRADTLALDNVTGITDLLLQSPALVINDNGGAAGLKSVNLRGLGAPHTTIRVDGIKVGNVLSGQVDLGLIGLENFSGAAIDNAQNSINFFTAKPVFNGRKIAGSVGFSGGSFSTYQPNGRLDFRLSDRLSLSVNAAGTVSKGDFPYIDPSLDPNVNSTAPNAREAMKRRENNDIKQVRGGIDLFGLIGSGDWKAKAYYNSSERGTPGSTQWLSTDRQTDRNAFVQGLMRKSWSPKYRMNIAGKVALDDNIYKSEWGDSDYHQTEFQLNTSHYFTPLRWLEVSAVGEYQRDNLKSNVFGAGRTGITAIAGAAIKLPRFHANLTLQYEGLFDIQGKNAEPDPASISSRNVLSPAIDIRLKAAEWLDVIGFIRRAYRAPTFNELYYPGYGNPQLKPEDAQLTDLGIDIHRQAGESWRVKAKVDAFYNILKDKITSAPTADNPSIWRPFNIDEVRSRGLDALASTSYSQNEWTASIDARYSLQLAENVPYLSKHAVVLNGHASYKGLALDAIWNWRGGRIDSYGEMPDWDTLDLILGKAFNIGRSDTLTLKLICRNICDTHYELVSGYPMPGASLTGSVEFKF